MITPLTPRIDASCDRKPLSTKITTVATAISSPSRISRTDGVQRKSEYALLKSPQYDAETLKALNRQEGVCAHHWALPPHNYDGGPGIVVSP
jgi:hypothetical protein